MPSGSVWCLVWNRRGRSCSRRVVGSVVCWCWVVMVLAFLLVWAKSGQTLRGRFLVVVLTSCFAISGWIPGGSTKLKPQFSNDLGFVTSMLVRSYARHHGTALRSTYFPNRRCCSLSMSGAVFLPRISEIRSSVLARVSRISRAIC